MSPGKSPKIGHVGDINNLTDKALQLSRDAGEFSKGPYLVINCLVQAIRVLAQSHIEIANALTISRLEKLSQVRKARSSVEGNVDLDLSELAKLKVYISIANCKIEKLVQMVNSFSEELSGRPTMAEIEAGLEEKYFSDIIPDFAAKLKALMEGHESLAHAVAKLAKVQASLSSDIAGLARNTYCNGQPEGQVNTPGTTSSLTLRDHAGIVEERSQSKETAWASAPKVSSGKVQEKRQILGVDTIQKLLEALTQRVDNLEERISHLSE